MKSERIALDPEHEASVLSILRAWAPGREVWAFGSRVRGAPKPFSDLDLAILGDEPLPPEARAALADAFEESDLPFRVDVLEWITLSERFREIVAREHAVLQETAPSEAAKAEPRQGAPPPSPQL